MKSVSTKIGFMSLYKNKALNFVIRGFPFKTMADKKIWIAF